MKSVQLEEFGLEVESVWWDWGDIFDKRLSRDSKIKGETEEQRRNSWITIKGKREIQVSRFIPTNGFNFNATATAKVTSI